MHTLRRNQRIVNYKTYAGKSDVIDSDGNMTGEKELTYSELKSIRAYVTAAKGNADTEPFGIDVPYSRVLITDDMRCDIGLDSIVWLDNPITGNHDYAVSSVAKSLNNICVALKEVDVS